MFALAGCGGEGLHTGSPVFGLSVDTAALFADGHDIAQVRVTTPGANGQSQRVVLRVTGGVWVTPDSADEPAVATVDVGRTGEAARTLRAGTAPGTAVVEATFAGSTLRQRIPLDAANLCEVAADSEVVFIAESTPTYRKANVRAVVRGCDGGRPSAGTRLRAEVVSAEPAGAVVSASVSATDLALGDDDRASLTVRASRDAERVTIRLSAVPPAVEGRKPSAPAERMLVVSLTP